MLTGGRVRAWLLGAILLLLTLALLSLVGTILALLTLLSLALLSLVGTILALFSLALTLSLTLALLSLTLTLSLTLALLSLALSLSLTLALLSIGGGRLAERQANADRDTERQRPSL